VIILVIDKHSVLALKRECQPPVAAHGYRPMSGKISLQRMQSPPRHIHIRCAGRRVEAAELQPKALGMFWPNPGFGAGAKEPLQAIVAKALDHEPVYLITIHSAMPGS